MTDFELFRGLDQGDKMDEKAFEQFKAQMQANAAQIQLIQQAEKKQKKKEDDLIAILMYFLKSHQKTEILLLVVRCLEQNIPAFFILSLILLISPEIQKQIGVNLQLSTGKEKLYPDQDQNSTSLINFDPHSGVLPLKIKIALDLWGKNIYEVAESTPHKILNTVLDHEKKLKSVVLKLTGAVLRDFLEQNNIDGQYEKINEFSEFLLTKILKKIEEQIKDQKELK